MSPRKKHRMLSRQEIAIPKKEMTWEIRKILRSKEERHSAAAKNITYDTGLSVNTIKKWLEGRNPPSLEHLLILARHYHDVLESFLKFSGNEYLIAHIRPRETDSGALAEAKTAAPNDVSVDGSRIYGAGICTINVTLAFAIAGKLNQRQLWFLGLLQQGLLAQVEAIVVQWGTSVRTARTDIAGLKRAGLIRWFGSQKTGRFLLEKDTRIP